MQQRQASPQQKSQDMMTFMLLQWLPHVAHTVVAGDQAGVSAHARGTPPLRERARGMPAARGHYGNGGASNASKTFYSSRLVEAVVEAGSNGSIEALQLLED